MSEKREIAKNNMIYIGGNFAAALLAFVFNVMVAALLQPEQFGLYSFVLVVMGFFIVFTDSGVSSTIIRFLATYMSKGEYGRARSLVGFFLKVRLGLAAGVAAVMLILSPQIATFFGKPEYSAFIALAAGILLASVLFDFASIALSGFKRFGSLVGIKLLERVMRMILVFVFVYMGTAAFGAVAGVGISFFIAGLVGMAIMRRSKKVFSAKGEPIEKRALFNFGIWVMASTIVTSVYATIDSVLVSAMRPVADIGFYGIAASWVSLITYIIPISSMVMYPYFSSLSAEKNIKALEKSIKYALMTAMPAAFLMSAFSAAIISIFYTPGYAAAASVLGVLCFISIPVAISPLLIMYLYGVNKSKTHTKIILSIFTTDVIVSYFAIGYAGIIGAAVSSLVLRLIEITTLLCVIYFKAEKGFAFGDVLKPLAASLVIFALALAVPVSGLLELVAYGIALLALYLGIMLALGGIGKSEIAFAVSWLRPIASVLTKRARH